MKNLKSLSLFVFVFSSSAFAEKEATPQYILDLTQQLKNAKGDSSKAEKAARDIDAEFEKGTYKFSDPSVMHYVFNAFECNASETLYTHLTTRLVSELEKNPKGVLDSALVVQCHQMGKADKAFFLAKIISCVLKNRATSYEQIDAALELGWSRFAPFKNDPLSKAREGLLKKVNEQLNVQVQNIQKNETSQYHCKLDSEKKKNELLKAVIEFQKALNKYIPIARDASAQAQPKDAHD